MEVKMRIKPALALGAVLVGSLAIGGPAMARTGHDAPARTQTATAVHGAPDQAKDEGASGTGGPGQDVTGSIPGTVEPGRTAPSCVEWHVEGVERGTGKILHADGAKTCQAPTHDANPR
jgi:hypothetical protein